MTGWQPTLKGKTSENSAWSINLGSTTYIDQRNHQTMNTIKLISVHESKFVFCDWRYFIQDDKEKLCSDQ